MALASRLEKALCSSALAPATSPACASISADGKLSACGRDCLRVSMEDRPRASFSQRCISWATGTHSLLLGKGLPSRRDSRSEEHTSELQSQSNLVCRLLLEKKKKKKKKRSHIRRECSNKCRP